MAKKLTEAHSFPDLVMKQRVTFTDLKHNLNLQYAMLFPAKLRVVAKGEAHFFEKPAAAIQWLDR